MEMKNALIKRAAASALVLALSIPTAQAQKKYDSGASDTEIKVGQTVPLSGPASAYAVIGKTQAA
jgi:branched-chain amino acid transport system substrate-binding protein